MSAEHEALRKFYVIVNPMAGSASLDEVRQAVETIQQSNGWEAEIYETTGQEDVAEVARAACRGGIDFIVAAGGDGTVSAVVDGAVNTGVPLAILPVGTGNGLARALGIPLDVAGAAELIAGPHNFQKIDALQVGEAYYVLNVSAGISARAMDKTEPEDKRRLGVIAYAQTIVQDVLQQEPLLFNLVLDGRPVQVRASEVLVSNGRILNTPPFLFGSRETMNDGQFDVNIVTAASASDYVQLAWDLLVNPEKPAGLHDLVVRKKLVIDVEGQPQPVQADGEVIGETPVEICLAHQALEVIVPFEEEASEGW